MALIKCPECGKDVSDTAETCPNCGFTTKRKKESKNGKLPAISMTIGIASLILSWSTFGIILGIIGLISGIISMAKKYSHKAYTIVGIITSLIAVMIVTVSFV